MNHPGVRLALGVQYPLPRVVPIGLAPQLLQIVSYVPARVLLRLQIPGGLVAVSQVFQVPELLLQLGVGVHLRQIFLF